MSAEDHPPEGLPLEPYTDPALEARLVAMILGESSDYERAGLEDTLALEPALRDLHGRLAEIDSLLSASESLESNDSPAADWKLSPERRSAVLEAIATPPEANCEPVAAAAPAKANRGGWNRMPWLSAAAAVLMLCFFVPTYWKSEVDGVKADADYAHALLGPERNVTLGRSDDGATEWGDRTAAWFGDIDADRYGRSASPSAPQAPTSDPEELSRALPAGSPGGTYRGEAGANEANKKAPAKPAERDAKSLDSWLDIEQPASKFVDHATAELPEDGPELFASPPAPVPPAPAGAKGGAQLARDTGAAISGNAPAPTATPVPETALDDSFAEDGKPAAELGTVGEKDDADGGGSSRALAAVALGYSRDAAQSWDYNNGGQQAPATRYAAPIGGERPPGEIQPDAFAIDIGNASQPFTTDEYFNGATTGPGGGGGGFGFGGGGVAPNFDADGENPSYLFRGIDVADGWKAQGEGKSANGQDPFFKQPGDPGAAEASRGGKLFAVPQAEHAFDSKDVAAAFDAVSGANAELENLELEQQQAQLEGRLDDRREAGRIAATSPPIALGPPKLDAEAVAPKSESERRGTAVDETKFATETLAAEPADIAAVENDIEPVPRQEAGAIGEALKEEEQLAQKTVTGEDLAKTMRLSGVPARGGDTGGDSTDGLVTNLKDAKAGGVEKSLELGNGFLQLGDYDKAEESLQEALALDPSSQEARAGLQAVEQSRERYREAARDHTRARLLGKVDQLWELGVPAEGENAANGRPARTFFESPPAPGDPVTGARSQNGDDPSWFQGSSGGAVLAGGAVVLDDSISVDRSGGAPLKRPDVERGQSDVHSANHENGARIAGLATGGLADQQALLAAERNEAIGDISAPGITDPTTVAPEWLRKSRELEELSIVRGIEGAGEPVQSFGRENRFAKAQSELSEIEERVAKWSQTIDIPRFETALETEPDSAETEMEWSIASRGKTSVNFGAGFSSVDNLRGLRDGQQAAELKQRMLEHAKAAIDLEVPTRAEPFSTFSLNVSDVSFKLAQAALLENGSWPEADKIRPEEFVNALPYPDPSPAPGEAVSNVTEQCVHPFVPGRNLLRVAMRTAATGRSASTPLRLTVLLDKSGSMEREDREASVLKAMEALAAQLGEGDEITVVGFARTPRLIADRLPGKDAGQLVKLVAETPSEGGTNLEEALRIAAESAGRQFLEGAQNRIVLITDGAANLGDASPDSLQQKIVELRGAGIAFDACGVGADGLNDKILEALTRKGDGRYYFLDRPEDADAGFVRQLAGALRPAARNVKVQVKFNPQRVSSYRLSGFEKHRLNKEDFRNDKVDAAELAAEESGNAVYQIEIDPAGQGDVGEVFVRFQNTATGKMVERSWRIPYDPSTPALAEAAPSMQLAATASMLADKLKGGPLGDLVDLGELAPTVAGLRSAPCGASARVQAFVAMFEKARQLQP